jgi:hypothetical protein
MGEISIALGALRASAEQLDRVAALLVEMSWPVLEPTALTGTAVGEAASSQRASARMSGVIADMRAWSAMARFTATELERAELSSADGLPSP